MDSSIEQQLKLKIKQLIVEGYKEINEISKLSDEIVNLLALSWVRISRVISRQGVFSTSLNKIITNKESYKTLNDFIENSNLAIVFFKSNPKNRGGFIEDQDDNGQLTIGININYDKFYGELSKQRLTSNDERQVKINAVNNIFKPIMVHELQHAYDHYRSNGNFKNTKKTHEFIGKYGDNIENWDKDPELLKNYYNLPHEIWARFSQAAYKLDLNKDINQFYQDFKNSFYKYELLSDEDKKRLGKAIYKYYDENQTTNESKFWNRKPIFEEIDSNQSEIDRLKKELWEKESWFQKNPYYHPKWKNNPTKYQETRENQEKKCVIIRKRLFDLTGDYYGETKKEKDSKKIKPKGLDDEYNNPFEVPKEIYRWLTSNSSTLYSDASDAVRWYRIINTKDESRYPDGMITIYRAVDNQDYDDIRPGDWVTTNEEYAQQHNTRYFNGKGKVISDEVNGRDVLVSPTGDRDEAIYAPLKYSADINY